jgi:mono/diheme cytochrome c family protein
MHVDRAKLVRFVGLVAMLLAGCQTQQPNPYNGPNLYLGYCAACHGGAGGGDGPVASSMNIPIPDLRTLAARNGGVYPRQSVVDVIDGREFRAGHGTYEMPVWGWQFRVAEEAMGGDAADARQRVDALAEYIGSLQSSR